MTIRDATSRHDDDTRWSPFFHAPFPSFRPRRHASQAALNIDARPDYSRHHFNGLYMPLLKTTLMLGFVQKNFSQPGCRKLRRAPDEETPKIPRSDWHNNISGGGALTYFSTSMRYYRRMRHEFIVSPRLGHDIGAFTEKLGHSSTYKVASF